MAQRFIESYDQVAEPVCHARQCNYMQYQHTVYQYTPGSLSRVIVECIEEEVLWWQNNVTCLMIFAERIMAPAMMQAGSVTRS